ncbi:hypothetical protein DFH29DRAFT_166655 [Suillus ampliporus]|nr:hypothetical protein DFH29DRAFT_166655 [Suillus ampliporus]
MIHSNVWRLAYYMAADLLERPTWVRLTSIYWQKVPYPSSCPELPERPYQWLPLKTHSSFLLEVADAFDNPSSRESRKDFRVNTIKIHRPQTSHSSQESQVQHARYARRKSSYFDVSYAYDDDEFADTSTIGNHSCASSETTKSIARITLYDDAFYTCDDTIALDESASDEMTKMLFFSSSPLDRLNNLARAELKKTGWFERSDQWSIVNMGLSSPTTPTRGPASPKTFPDILSPILPSIPAITAIPPPSFTEIPTIPIFTSKETFPRLLQSQYPKWQIQLELARQFSRL